MKKFWLKKLQVSSANQITPFRSDFSLESKLTYFYFYCVVKCGNRALGINERIKKSSQTQKWTQTHNCREVIEGPARDPNQKDFKRESTSRTSREFIFGDVTIGFVCFSTHPRRTQDGFKSARHVDNKPYFIDVKHV
jgi:hypothetical protein